MNIKYVCDWCGMPFRGDEFPEDHTHNGGKHYIKEV